MEEYREIETKILGMKRVAKTITGGKRMRISVCCAAGDNHSRVGVAIAKAAEPSNAALKAGERAKKNMILVKRVGDTIPHEVWGKCGACKILIKPASPGTGLIACEVVRDILRLAGIKDALTKAYGSVTTINLAYAVIDALKKLRTPEDVENLRKRKVWRPRWLRKEEKSQEEKQEK